MCSAIFLRITLICSTRSPSTVFGAGGGCVPAPAAGAGWELAGFADIAGAWAGAPDSIKLRMSFFVTRPLIPVPSSDLMSMPCSSAILRTSGLDFVRRNSSAPVALPSSRCVGAGGISSLFFTSGFTSVLCAEGGAVGAPCSVVVIRGFGRSTAAGASAFGDSGRGELSAFAGADSFARALASGFAAGFAPSPSSTATTVFTSTVSPSLNLISVRVPAAGEGISASTLSVEISNNGSSRSTWSPTFFIHLVIVPSAMDSPICGITTSVAMMTPI